MRTLNVSELSSSVLLKTDRDNPAGEVSEDAAQWVASLSQVCRKNWLNPIIEDDQRRYSGFDINNLVNALKAKFRRIDFSKQRVGILMQPSASQAFAIVALMRLGASPVIFNHWLKPDDVKSRLDQLGGSILLTDKTEAYLTEGSGIAEVFVSDSACRILSFDQTAFLGRVAERDPGECMVIFTSGSMGEPKAISISFKALNYITKTLIKYLNLGESSRAIVTLPMFHTMALNTQFFPTILAGGSCKVEHIELSMNQLYRKIVDSRASFVALLCDMLPICAKEKARRGGLVAEHVTDVQLAGGVIRSEDLALVKELFPNARVHKGYGMTETIRTTMISSEDPKFFTPAIGRPLPGQDIEVRDEMGNICEPGEAGQFYVKSPTVALGYINLDREMNVDERGYFATGDLGYKDDDGILYFVGRHDRIFKSQGRKVSPLEIENLARAESWVQTSYCTAAPCASRGYVPVLWILPKSHLSPDEVTAFVAKMKEKLENYKCPRAVVCLNALPRLANGKVDGSALKVLWTDVQKLPSIRLPNSVKMYDPNRLLMPSRSSGELVQ